MQNRKNELADLKKLLARLDKTDGADSTTIGEARRRREVAEAKLAEFAAAEREGKLLDRDEVKAAWEGLILHAREQLMGIPSQIQDRLAGMTDAVAIGRLLEQEIRRALTAMSVYQPGKAKARSTRPTRRSTSRVSKKST